MQQRNLSFSCVLLKMPGMTNRASTVLQEASFTLPTILKMSLKPTFFRYCLSDLVRFGSSHGTETDHGNGMSMQNVGAKISVNLKPSSSCLD